MKRKAKNIKIGQRCYAKLNKPLSKLELPINGPFIALEKRGSTWKLREVNTNKTFTVHEDRIITQQKILEEEIESETTQATVTPIQGMYSPHVPHTTVKEEVNTEDATHTESESDHRESTTPPEPVAQTRRIQPPRQCKVVNLHLCLM